MIASLVVAAVLVAGPVDVCSNLPGVQETIPVGMEQGPAVGEFEGQFGPTCVPADPAVPVVDEVVAEPVVPVEAPGVDVPVEAPVEVAVPVQSIGVPHTIESLPVTGPEDDAALLLLGVGLLGLGAGCVLVARRAVAS